MARNLLSQNVVQDIGQILQNSISQVRREVRDHWNKKISQGIIPTELIHQSGGIDKVDTVRHYIEVLKLAKFEASNFNKILDKIRFEKHDEVHYFGIGTGEGLEKVAEIAHNRKMAGIVAYDIAESGCQNGKRVFEHLETKIKGGIDNAVYIADIESACSKTLISPEKGRILVAPRVLDVLNTQEASSPRKKESARKMARTARKIGEMMYYLDVMLIHPCPEDNPNAIWGDTTPHPLEEVVGYMQDGSRTNLAVEILGKHNFHGHIYTAVHIHVQG